MNAMKRFGLSGIALAAMLSAACSAPQAASPAPGAPSGAAPAQGAAPAAPKVNRVVMAVPAPSTESNQPRNIGQTTMWQIAPMYEYLIHLDANNGKLVPGLATEWNVAPDAGSIRFKLRQGVEFQGGNGQFTAKDVVHSWKDLTQQDATAGYQVVLARRTIKDVETVSDSEVVLRLQAKDSDLINMISQAQGGFEIMSKAHFDKAGDPSLTTPPIAGTGPYQYKARSQGQNFVFERVPYKHWRVTPDFPEFEFRWVKEASTRLASLIAGEVHVTSLPSDLLPQATKAGHKIVVGKVPALRTFVSIWCCYLKDSKYVFPDSPLADVRVRKALNKALDRDALNKAFFQGKGTLTYGFNHIPETHAGFNPQWKERFKDEYGYDPAKAQQLLAEAGYSAPKPMKTTMFVHPLATFSGAEDIVEAMAGAWRKIGVDVQLSNMDTTQMGTLSRDCKLDNHMDIIGTSGAPIVAYGYYNATVVGNCGGYQHPDTDASFEKIRQELDPEKHGPLWRTVGDLAYPLHASIPLFWLPAEAVVNTTVVADYPWPGSISGTWTHVETLKAVK